MEDVLQNKPALQLDDKQTCQEVNNPTSICVLSLSPMHRMCLWTCVLAVQTESLYQRLEEVLAENAILKDQVRYTDVGHLHNTASEPIILLTVQKLAGKSSRQGRSAAGCRECTNQA